MQKVEVAKDVYYVGCKDWKCRDFHGYVTPAGVTYNSYLIKDEKTCLIDLVKDCFVEEFLARVKAVVELDKIDYIVINHVENDHTSGLRKIMEKIPQAKIYITAAGAKEAKCLYGQYDYNIVKDGDQLKIGDQTLTFLTLPMLHWPDSMATYLNEQEVIFSNDAFGQHLCASNIFDDQNDLAEILAEARTYYANILQPYTKLICPALEKLSKFSLKMICPSHGLIWRSHLSEILAKYSFWGQAGTTGKVLVVYDTMWGATEGMAQAIFEGVCQADVKAKLYKLGSTEMSEIVSEMLEADGVLFGSPTHNYGMIETMGGFLTYLKGLKPAGKAAAVFGTYGWSGGAQKDMEELLQKAGMDIQEALVANWSANLEEIESCEKFGYEFAKKACSK